VIGEWLYQLNPKEQLSQPALQRIAVQASGSAAAGEVDADTADTFVPLDQIFVVKSIAIRATPGAAQTARTFIAQLLDNNGAVIQDLAAENNNPAIAAAINVGTSWQGEWLLMPRERLRGAVLFNAGAAANAVLLGVHGFFLPRGSLQHR
jgi:hypothetical protein